MISYKIDKGILKELAVAGEPSEIMADIAALISFVYGGILRSNGEEAADDFRKFFLMLALDHDISKKVFDTELIDIVRRSGNAIIGSEKISVDENAIALMKIISELKKSQNEEEDEE